MKNYTSQNKSELEEILKIGRHKKRGRGWIRYGLLVLLVGFGLAGFFAFQKEKGVVTYTSKSVERGNITVLVYATGTIEPTNLVEISSELSGTLATVDVDYNDAVEVGQVLARLDTTKLEAEVAVREASLISAEAGVAQAQAALHEAAENYEISEALDKRGVTSHQSFISATATYERAVASLQIADAARNLAEASLELQQADLAKAVIRSPIKGIILDRDADVGQIVASSLAAPILFMIAEDLSKMELQVDVDEADIGRISVGNHATFTVEAYDETSFPAEIAEIRFASETIDGVVSYKTILSINNEKLLLRPGMTATSEIIVDQVTDALLVPNAALRYAPPQVIEDDSGSGGGGLLGMIMPSPSERDDSEATRANGKTVWILEDGIAREIAVKTGQSDGKFTAILGETLVLNAMVIISQTEAQ